MTGQSAAARLSHEQADQLGGLFWTFDSLAGRGRRRSIDSEPAFRQTGHDRSGDNLVDVNTMLPDLHRETLREHPDTSFSSRVRTIRLSATTTCAAWSPAR